MGKAKPPEHPSGEFVDPDPIVVDLLVGLATTGLASLIVRAGKGLLGHRRKQRGALHQAESSRADGVLSELRARITSLEGLIDEALALVGTDVKRELGGVLMLSRADLERHRELREALFNEIRSVDTLTAEMGAWDVEASGLPSKGRPRIPAAFNDHLTFIAKRLKSAQTARFAGQAFLEMKGAASEMRQCLEYLERSR